MNKAYSALADHYDSLMCDFEYAKYYDFVKNYATGDVLELACGSGTFTGLLLGSANSVIAVDNSREMLNVAESRNFRNRRFVQFVESSMLDFECMHRVDNAFCVCDGVNYIPKKDLGALAKRVNQNIKLGAHFVFDVSSSYKLSKIIGNNVFYEDNEDITYLWTNTLSSHSVDMELVIFERDGEMYRRKDEQHTQYIHEIEDIYQTFENNGFEIASYDGESFGEVQPESKRWIFVAKKVSEVK